MYPDTDIAGEWVTTEVGRLSQEKIQEALRNGLSKAHLIRQKGFIKAALVAVKDQVAWTSSLEPLLKKLQ
jgi:hypothetical protein